MSLDIETYKRHINENISYIKDGKQRTGRLMSIRFDDDQKQLMAEIHSDNLSHFFNPIVHMPLHCVTLPSTNGPSSSKNWQERTPNDGKITGQQFSCHPEYFLYNHVKYDKCLVLLLKLGDEVVWLLPENSIKTSLDIPYIGRIRFLGQHEAVTGNKERVAVVEFDQKTDHLPGFLGQARIAYSQISTNVVKIEELMGLQNWLSTSSKTGRSSDNSFYPPEIGEHYLSSAKPEEPWTGWIPDLRNKYSGQLPSTSKTIPKTGQKKKISLSDLIDLDDAVSNLSTSGVLKPSTSNANEGDWRAPICLERSYEALEVEGQSGEHYLTSAQAKEPSARKGKLLLKEGVVGITNIFDKPLSENYTFEPLNRNHRKPTENQDVNEKAKKKVKQPKSTEVFGLKSILLQPSIKSQDSFTPFETHKATKNDALFNETALNKSNKNRVYLRSKTKVEKTFKKIPKLLGNCCAKVEGFIQATVEYIKVGDLVVADLTDVDIVAGEVKLTCKIGNSPTTYIGCQFEQPLRSSRFYIEHSTSATYCTNNCKDEILAFIPQDLFYGESRAFNVLSSEPLKSEKKLEKEKETHFTDVDFAVEAKRSCVFASTPIDYFHVNRSASKVKVEGICGRLNSCYADVSLFAMFAFTDAFDYCLNSPATEGISQEKALINKAICKIIQYDIVSPLRVKGKVGADAMKKLRSCLYTYDEQYSTSLMDAEEFMLVLLESIMSNPPFYTFNSGATDYIFQIFATFQEKTKTASLQGLLARSFDENDIKLLDIPNPAFILRLPVCDGKPLFEMVLPNLEIELKDLLEPLEPLTGASTRMLLRAVICLKNNHYTCFARASQGKDAFWAHFDSRPKLESPVVHWIGNLSQMLQDPDHPRDKYPAEDCETFDYLMRQADICIYERISEHVGKYDGKLTPQNSMPMPINSIASSIYNTGRSAGAAAATTNSTVAELPLNIRTMDGKILEFPNVKTDWTVKQLKEEFADRHNQRWSDVILHHRGKRLRDNDLLSKRNIEPHAIVMVNY